MNLNFIWLGGTFPYAYQLAVESAVKVHKFDKAILWHTSMPSGPYFEAIKDKVVLQSLEAKKFLSVDRTKNTWIQMSNLKDYYAYRILYEEGGILLDLDTLSLKDVSGLLGDYDLLVPIDCPPAQMPIEFPYGSSMFIGRKGAPCLKEMMDVAEHIFQQPWEIKWGAAGPVLVTTTLKKYPDKVKGAEFGVLGGFGGHEAKQLYLPGGSIRENCHVIHMFAYAWKEGWATVTPEYVKTSDSLYARTARKVCNIGAPGAIPLTSFQTELNAWLRRGEHYRPMFDWLMMHPCRNIMDIGTYDGKNSIMMIKAASMSVPENEIHLHGFDLFEGLTPELKNKEFSYPSPGDHTKILESMKKQTSASVTLYAGDTKETLPACGVDQLMDFIYIDGGHSEETILNDWNNIQRFVGANTVVFLDDYFVNKPGFGCKFLLPLMKGYNVTTLPRVDSYTQEDRSILKIQLVQALPVVAPTKVAHPEISDDEWAGHQKAEKGFWSYDKNVSYGLVKEQAYVPFLGIDEYRQGPYFNLKGKSVIDVGGGPVSLLLRCTNFKRAVVLDPCTFDKWLLDRYDKNNIEFINAKAETYVPDQMYDEAWIYNVLQHVQSPEKVVAMMKKYARKIRVFEWRETPVSVGHPHTFTTEQFDTLFERKGNARSVVKGDLLEHLIHNTEEKIYWGVFDYPKIDLDACDARRSAEKTVIKYKNPKVDKFRFHYPGLVHLPVSRTYMACAFTQKIVKLSEMLTSMGHEVIIYGAEGSDAPCTEFVQTHTLADIKETWGEPGGNTELGYDWRHGEFRHDFNAERKDVTKRFYARCAVEINKRKRDDDFLLLPQGQYHKPIDDLVKLWLTCEPGIGYRGSYTKYKAFESAYLQNFTYGSKSPFQSINGNYYDRVIPNYFDPKDFQLSTEKGDYYLFIGRMIERKGIMTAVKATEAIGAKLILAGQTDPSFDIKKLPAHCTFVGYVEPSERLKLMQHAIAVFVPTLYLEAFGGVNVEAQLCGTPAITTSFGCFSETVKHGQTGFLCNTLQDFVDAARNAPILDPQMIRKHAERYLMDNVKWEYQKWFEDLYQLYLSARVVGTKGWSNLS